MANGFPELEDAEYHAALFRAWAAAKEAGDEKAVYSATTTTSAPWRWACRPRQARTSASTAW